MKASLSFAVLLSRIAVYSASVIACIVATPAPGAESSAPPLFERLGSHHVEITTRSEPAQKYFDQGIRLVYAFNHEEAVRSFEEAARLDPDAPMLYWARPLRWGPISMHRLIDGRKSGRRILFKKPGRDCSMSRRVSGRMSRHWPNGIYRTRRRRDVCSMNPMPTPCGKSSRHIPDDLDAATLFAEALMDLRPWDYWKADGRPQPGTEEIIATLESVLRRGPDHPGACHYYIHAVEASREPQRRALACAKRLADLMPGAGHLVHMPAHVYMRLGLQMNS